MKSLCNKCNIICKDKGKCIKTFLFIKRVVNAWENKNKGRYYAFD